MTRLADGDRTVFTAVFKTLWQPTLRLCKSMLGNDADAADAAQEAMEKIFERASDYDPRRPALPWTMAIAAWECRTIRRRKSRRHEVSEEAAPETCAEAGEDDIVLRDLAGAALEAAGTLSSADRETLVATFLDEAASVSGPTLRKRRERAIDRLRGAFKRLYGLE